MTNSATAGGRSRSTGPTAATSSPEMIRNQQLRDLVSQRRNGGRFTAHLYSWGALVIIALGALFAILSNAFPDSLAQILTSAGLVAAAGIVLRVRRAAHYTAMVHPLMPSIAAGVLLGCLYTAGRAGIIWLQNGHLDDLPGIGINFLIAVMVLSFATRYGIHLRVATDNYLPEGMPSEVAEEMDSFIELTESPESPKTTTPLSGEPEDRVAANREAVQLLQVLANDNPSVYEPRLAFSLNELGLALARAGRQADALQSLRRAAEIRQRLARANPAAYEPDLATSLHDLGWLLGEMQSWHDALEPLRRALEIRQRLAQANPTVYESLLADTRDELRRALSR